VTPENVEVVREALDRAAIEYRLLTFEDEGHGIRKQHNLRTLYATLTTFFTEAFADVGSW
jgi:dipeptidyl aminopeptidase/acylaminoacyl peptidase